MQHTYGKDVQTMAEYLVHTSGEISTYQNKAYAIRAESQQEAEATARRSFEREFDCISIETQAQSYTRTKRAVAACILMLAAILLSLGNYSYIKDGGWFRKDTVITVALKPEMTSTLFAIVFYSIFVIRFKGIRRVTETKIDIAFTVLSVLLFSTMFRLILGGENLNLFGLIKLPDPKVAILIAIFASLLGVKLVSVGCMFFVAFAALSNLMNADKAMGLWGVAYIMCSFLGILLCLSVEPAVLEALPQIKNSFVRMGGAAKKELADAKGQTKAIADKLSK